MRLVFQRQDLQPVRQLIPLKVQADLAHNGQYDIIITMQSQRILVFALE
jgi:hypothetical protein